MQPRPTIRLRTTSFEVFKKVIDAVRASSVMTSRDEFEYCKSNDLLDEKFELMEDKLFDVIPMLHGADLETGEFFEYVSQGNIREKIKQGLKYCKDASARIEEEDRISEDLPMEEVIRKFSIRRNKSKIPLFLIDNHNRIVGLITLADLDKVAVKIYFFALISELELHLRRIISGNYEELKEVCNCSYCVRKREARKEKAHSHDNLEEYYYLYIKELIHIIVKSECLCKAHRMVKEAMGRKGYGEIVKLRNAIAHVKPLVSDKFPINRLDRIQGLIKDMVLICNRFQDIYEFGKEETNS